MSTPHCEAGQLIIYTVLLHQELALLNYLANIGSSLFMVSRNDAQTISIFGHTAPGPYAYVQATFNYICHYIVVHS